MTGVVSPPLLADDRSLLEKLVEPLAHLPAAERAAATVALLETVGVDEAAFLLSWEGQRRPSQVIDPRTDAMWVLVVGGRQSGKTRTGAETICDRIEADELHHGGLVSRTPGDVRRVMVEGPKSGLMVCAEQRGIRIDHHASLAQLKVVDGGVISTYSAQEPDQLRGPQHDTVWLDEFGAWPLKRDSMGNTAFTNATAGLSLGDNPLGFATTTPKAIPEIRDILNDRTGKWRVVRMTTWANAANLAPGYIDTLRRMFGGTRLAAQEFEGLYVEDTEGALWTTVELEATRIRLEPGQSWRDVTPALVWSYVAVDPSVSSTGSGDECGIVAGGVGLDRRFYVTVDASGAMGPREWADKAVWAFREVDAQFIVAEGNQGGALVREVIHNVDPTIPVEIVHASVGKRARAEPVAMLWQAEEGTQPMASIVGSLPALEAELTGWDAATSRESPNRLDALAWLGAACLPHLFEAQSSWSASAGNLRLPV